MNLNLVKPISLESPPVSTPIAAQSKGVVSTSQPWQRWLIKVGQFATAAHNVGTVTAANGEQLTYVRNGALLSYSYTGLGGLTFNVNGTQISIPQSTTSIATNSHVIIGA